jgi:hypothetical protein
MANVHRVNYTVTVSKEFKQRLVKLPVEVHRAFANPMRRHLEKLVEKAEARAAKNGRE